MARVNVTLNEEFFGVQPNIPVMHQVVTAQLARRRAGTQSTKTRSEVRGGGRKPYRQKGTGNARQGSTNAPHYAGGGVALGPKPRSYAQRTPKKMIKLALRSALSDRAAAERVLVVDAFAWSEPSTKQAATTLASLGVDGRTLVVIERGDATAALSFRNIPAVQLCHVGELNAYDVLCSDWIVFTQSALAHFDQQSADTATPAPDSERSEPSRTVSEQPDAGEASPMSGGVVAPADGSQPEGYPIKGNADSMRYHLPNGRWFANTVAEYWFDTEESAKAAGYTKAGSTTSTAEPTEPTDEPESPTASAPDPSDDEAGSVTASAPDPSEDEAGSVTASTPVRSDNDDKTGVGSASEQPDSEQPDSERSEPESKEIS